MDVDEIFERLEDDPDWGQRAEIACRHCDNPITEEDDGVWSENARYAHTTAEESADMSRQCGLSPDGRHKPEGCVCVRHDDGSVTTMLCSMHAEQDPCATMAQVTGRRRRGTIRRGTCTNCGWGNR